MLWDSGLSAAAMDNVTAVDNKIAEMDNTFSLVMIAERWDESVILLKDLLCWDFRDLVNFKLNARKENKKIPLSEVARAALKEYLAADYKLYNHFKKKFDAQVSSFGARRMKQERGTLELANAKMKERCGINKGSIQKKKKFTFVNSGFYIFPVLREKTRIKLDNVNRTRKHQNALICNSGPNLNEKTF